MSKSDYNFPSRVLHRLALQSKIIPEISFDIENALNKKKDKIFSENHVFISGLARSGTTVLMRYFYETGLFRSLTYLDMPFVLMPNTWKRISYKPNSTHYKERAHQDGIMLGFDSPEAFEEVFWRVFCGGNYIKDDSLLLHKISYEVLEKFKDYIHNIINSGESTQTRYLSKNNNNILRFNYLQKSMPNAHIIVPFRNPLQHSYSLLSQHLNFSKTQISNKFSLDYMNWLGHFEFGLNQKSFFLNNEDIFEKMKQYPKNDINFWLLNWKNYYEYAAAKPTKNTLFFNYELFCQEPARVLNALFCKLSMDAPTGHFERFNPPIKTAQHVNTDLLEDCMTIYKQLENKFNLWYND